MKSSGAEVESCEQVTNLTNTRTDSTERLRHGTVTTCCYCDSNSGIPNEGLISSLDVLVVFLRNGKVIMAVNTSLFL